MAGRKKKPVPTIKPKEETAPKAPEPPKEITPTAQPAEVKNEASPLDEALREAEGVINPKAVGAGTAPLPGGGGLPSLPPAGSVPGIPQPDPEALVNLVEVLTVQTCKVYCIGQKVPWDTKMEQVCRFSKVDRDQLMMTAPYAAPYVGTLIEKAPAIGAILFGVSYFGIVVVRLREIQAKAPPKEKRKEKEETAAESTADPLAGEPEKGKVYNG